MAGGHKSLRKGPPVPAYADPASLPNAPKWALTKYEADQNAEMERQREARDRMLPVAIAGYNALKPKRMPELDPANPAHVAVVLENPQSLVERLEAPVSRGGHGKYEDQPGWRNAEQYADAVRAHAHGFYGMHHDGSLLDGLKELAGFYMGHSLMSPEQYAYQQKVGRTIDLLQNLKNNPARAGGYWDSSDYQRLNRDPFNQAYHQKGAGWGKAFGEFMNAGTGNVVPYAINAGQMVPDTIKNAARGDDSTLDKRHPAWFAAAPGLSVVAGLLSRATDAAASAGANFQNKDRVRLSETPILDLPDDATPNEYKVGRANEQKFSDALKPYPAQNIANAGWRAIGLPKLTGMDSAPAVVGDAIDTGLDMLDPTMMAELGLQAAKIGAKWIPRLLAKEAGPEAAVESGIRSMLPSPQNPDRDKPRPAYQQVLDSLAPYGSYFTTPKPDEPVDNDAHWRAVRDVEQKKPQSISGALNSAYYGPFPADPKFGTAPRWPAK